MRARRAAIALALALAGAFATPAAAQVTGYTSRAAFLAALPGAPATITFEAFAPGTLLPSGSALGAGVSVTYAIDDGAGGLLTLAVVDRFLTTSGTRSLGVDDPANEDQLLLGDELDFSIAGGTRAFGLTIVSSDPLFDGDVRLVTAQGEAANDDFEESELPDGGLVYFVGLVAPAPFTQVALRYGAATPIGAAIFNVDDVTLVPEPGAGAGALVAASALGALARRHRKPEETS